MRKVISFLLALTVILSLAACTAAAEKPAADEPITLVYGSGDYTRINPAMDEHGEINILLFNGLTAHEDVEQGHSPPSSLPLLCITILSAKCAAKNKIFWTIEKAAW